MQGMQQAEKGDGIQAKEGGMTTDYPQPPRSRLGLSELLGATNRRMKWEKTMTPRRQGAT